MNLRVDQLNEKEIFIENAKGTKDRIIYCSPKIYKEYLKYMRSASRLLEFNEVNQEAYGFLTKEGKQYNYILAERVLIKIGNQYHICENVRGSPYTFRHYFSQKLVRNHTDIYTIQKLLGHTAIKTIEVYLRSLNIEGEIEKVVKYSPLQICYFLSVGKYLF